MYLLKRHVLLIHTEYKIIFIFDKRKFQIDRDLFLISKINNNRTGKLYDLDNISSLDVDEVTS